MGWWRPEHICAYALPPTWSLLTVTARWGEFGAATECILTLSPKLDSG